MSGQQHFWRWIENLTCKGRNKPDDWSPQDEYTPWLEAIRYYWKVEEPTGSFYAHLALMRMGHFPRTPFFTHMYAKLRSLGKLRGVSKQKLFENLPLEHLERLKPHLNTDEVLSLAIEREASEWVYNHPWLAEPRPAPRPAAQPQAGQQQGAGEPRDTAAAPKEEVYRSRKRERSSSGEGQEPKRRRLGRGGEREVAVKEEVAEEVAAKEDAAATEDSAPADRKGDSIFLYDDDSDVL